MKNFNREKVRKEIERMRYEYARLQSKAQDEGDEAKSMQFAGAYLALDLLLSNLGLDNKWDEEDREEDI